MSSIDEVSDKELYQIFKCLPPYDRLRVSEVCWRWYDISRMLLADVTRLDLSQIPGPGINAVIKHCPNLQTVFASQPLHFTQFDISLIPGASIGDVISQCPNLQTVFGTRQTFDASNLSCLSRFSLSSISFTNCTINGIVGMPTAQPNTLSVQLFGDAPSGSLGELALNNVALQFANAPANATYVVRFTASGLRRLQLTGLGQLLTNGGSSNVAPSSILFPCDSLTHAIYHSNAPLCPGNAAGWNLADFNEDSLLWLRELFLAPLERQLTWSILSTVLHCYDSVTALRVLFLHETWSLDKWSLGKLIAEHPTLRILVLTGSMIARMGQAEIKLEARSLHPKGVGSAPLPLLHIFVGKGASEKILFTESDAVMIHPINEPLPQFLARADVAAIFTGVWIAEKIKEAANRRENWFDYAADMATHYRVVPNQQ